MTDKLVSLDVFTHACVNVPYSGNRPFGVPCLLSATCNYTDASGVTSWVDDTNILPICIASACNNTKDLAVTTAGMRAAPGAANCTFRVDCNLGVQPH